jgi:ABC-type dipeptide/oligopeptide/nickel transport system permease component
MARTTKVLNIIGLYFAILFTNVLLIKVTGLSELDGALSHDLSPISYERKTLLTQVLTFDFDASYFHHEPVFEYAFKAFTTSLKFASCCYILLILIATSLAIGFYYYPLPFIQKSLRTIAALPSVWILCFCWFLLDHYTIFIQKNDYAWMMGLMVILKSLGIYVDFINKGLSSEFQKPYIMFLENMGATSPIVLLRYTLKSTFLLLASKLPLKFLQLLFSVLIFETLLGLPGFGSIMLHAILSYDQPLVAACIVTYSFVTAISIFISQQYQQKLYALS